MVVLVLHSVFIQDVNIEGATEVREGRAKHFLSLSGYHEEDINRGLHHVQRSARHSHQHSTQKHEFPKLIRKSYYF